MTPIRIAVIDSGVHAAHPHVQGVAGGVGIDDEGREYEDYLDRLGHGTAVTAAIREKAPDAEIYAVKVFDRELASTGRALVAAIEWSAKHRADLINLSLGTTNPAHERALADAVAATRRMNALVVAAAPQPEARWLPGALPGVVSVELDWTIARDAYRWHVLPTGQLRIIASGYPRPIPGVPPERNLKGSSFAVANATGLIAGMIADCDPARDRLDYLAASIRAVGDASGISPSG